MAGKHRKTHAKLIANPVLANIAWNDVVTMMEALGCVVTPGGGSMFSFELNGVSTVIHRPHPGNEISRNDVRTFRRFLEEAGANPDDL